MIQSRAQAPHLHLGSLLVVHFEYAGVDTRATEIGCPRPRFLLVVHLEYVGEDTRATEIAGGRNTAYYRGLFARLRFAHPLNFSPQISAIELSAEPL